MMGRRGLQAQPERGSFSLSRREMGVDAAVARSMTKPQYAVWKNPSALPLTVAESACSVSQSLAFLA